jgi:hypothetical protein
MYSAGMRVPGATALAEVVGVAVGVFMMARSLGFDRQESKPQNRHSVSTPGAK